MDRQGLYDPRHEHDACGVGFVADIHGRASRDIVDKGLQILQNIDHRGAAGAEKNTGDGTGILLQIPDSFYRTVMAEQGVTLPDAGAFATGIAFLLHFGWNIMWPQVWMQIAGAVTVAAVMYPLLAWVWVRAHRMCRADDTYAFTPVPTASVTAVRG